MSQFLQDHQSPLEAAKRTFLLAGLLVPSYVASNGEQKMLCQGLLRRSRHDAGRQYEPQP